VHLNLNFRSSITPTLSQKFSREFTTSTNEFARHYLAALKVKHFAESRTCLVHGVCFDAANMHPLTSPYARERT
jgi:hypothetical protein